MMKKGSVRFFSRIFPVLLGLFLAGCKLASVNVTVVGERSALENQMLGSYAALDEDLQMSASVRGIDPTGKIETPPPKSAEKLAAEKARETQQLYADDLYLAKSLQWVGEKKDGHLALLPLERSSKSTLLSAEQQQFIKQVQEPELTDIVRQLNEAREAIWKRILETTPGLQPGDLPKVQELFAKLRYEEALPGEMLENEKGQFEPRAERQLSGQ